MREMIIYRTTDGLDPAPTDPPVDPTPTDPPADPPSDPPTDPPADPPTDPPSDPEPSDVTYELNEKLKSTFGDDQDAVNEATEFAKSAGLTQEQFDSVFEFMIEKVTGDITQQQTALKEENMQGLTALRDDVGADNYTKMLGHAEKFINTLDKEGTLREFIVKTDLANNASFIQMMSKAGELISEDGLSYITNSLGDKPKPNAAGGDGDLAKKFYPNMK